jgi:glycine cleavage system H protein
MSFSYPTNLRYTKSHEWARREETKTVVGITEYAQKELSDVVFVELPVIGKEVVKGKPCAVVESVKAAFDIYAPVSGKVIGVNHNIEANPSLINMSPYGDGWFFEIEPSSLREWEELMDAEKYGNLIHENAS